MEIIQENFQRELPVILDAIRNADFLSFDSEFTGFGDGAKVFLPFDTPALVYGRARENLGNYTVIQFGLCCFRYDAVNKRFTHRAFNFYVFPRLPEEIAVSLRSKSAKFQNFSCQPDNLEFLSRQKFDFNKWIWNGVGFVRKSTIDELKAEVTREHNWKIKSELKVQVAKTLPGVHKAEIDALTKSVDKFMKTDELCMSIKDLEQFKKRLLVSALENKYNSSLFYEYARDSSGSFSLKIFKCTEENTKKDMLNERHEKKLAVLDESAGFCKVIKAITDSRKLVVGHNIYFDLLHTIKAFCCDLPSSYQDFKHTVKDNFPNIIDTKVISAHASIKKLIGFSNSLFQLYKRLETEPFQVITSDPEHPDYTYEHCANNHHEAGYDAYLTGLVFISLLDFLGKQKIPTSSVEASALRLDTVKALYNKVAAGRVVDMAFFDLSLSPEADMCPDRSHIFYLTFSCDEWNNDNIGQLFSPYGDIQIGWIDAESCFITLKDRRRVKDVLKNLVENGIKSNVATKHNGKTWSLEPSIVYFKRQEALLCSINGQTRTLSEQSIQDLTMKKIKLNKC